MYKTVLILLGTLSLVLGALGVVLPGLPTTPFVLLAAGLYLRSSQKLYVRLKQSRLFGPVLRRYMEQKGMTKGEKIGALSLMWVMIGLSCLAIDSLPFRIAVLALGTVGTVVMGSVVATVDAGDSKVDGPESRRDREDQL